MLLSSNDDTFFLNFQKNISGIELPEKFTFPFCYEPHDLCKIAANEVQNFLATQKEWDFKSTLFEKSTGFGKMFGVLIVKNKKGELGYLAAFSGKLGEKTHYPQFVPPIFDTLEVGGFFKIGENEINQVNKEVFRLESEPDFLTLKSELKKLLEDSKTEIFSLKELNKNGKIERQQKRDFAAKLTDIEKQNAIINQLNLESTLQSSALKSAKRKWEAEILSKENEIAEKLVVINLLKEKRKKMSLSLQNRLFERYIFLNIEKKEKSISEIFAIDEEGFPPSGAGECAAPKLLQFAFTHDYSPIALAEFWWGESPSSEIRKHGHFYPACKSKCKPILAHMLEGMSVDTDPTTLAKVVVDDFEICYEDDFLVVINKPSGFLSVPGTKLEDSVFHRMKAKYPEASGPMIVHRLDQSTSGLMVVAKTLDAYHHLQKQFLKKKVKKRYVALLEGHLEENEGQIDLPLRVDLDNRPRQLVCYEHGKTAVTNWKVIEKNENFTRVHFFPITGRTHQLRVHAAHTKGLNMPIVGDDLYGKRKNRLHLHAEEINFLHPISLLPITVFKVAEF